VVACIVVGFVVGVTWLRKRSLILWTAISASQQPSMVQQPLHSTREPERLKNVVCLVTGASRGIGKGIALELGSQGAIVYITGTTTNDGSVQAVVAVAVLVLLTDVVVQDVWNADTTGANRDGSNCGTSFRNVPLLKQQE
jgi:hypothetical protein